MAQDNNKKHKQDNLLRAGIAGALIRKGAVNTLFFPLVARINISKKYPEYFMDEKALELERYLPQGADKCGM